MFNYEKRLEYPVHITRTDPKAAMVIISQYGGLYSASLEIKITTYLVFNNKHYSINTCAFFQHNSILFYIVPLYFSVVFSLDEYTLVYPIPSIKESANCSEKFFRITFCSSCDKSFTLIYETVNILTITQNKITIFYLDR